MSGLKTFLSLHTKIALDTSVFIFHIEDNPKYAAVTYPIFEWLARTGEGVTSSITMLELLVQPYRMEDEDLVGAYYALFTTYPHLQWSDVTLPIADRAAKLRAKYNLRTPDAIQAATAIATGATALISNDRSFRKIHDFKVLILDDLIH